MKIQYNKRNRQYSLMLPREVCLAMNLIKGANVSIKIIDAHTLELKINEVEKDDEQDRT